jgi:hypothetical protein
MVRKAYQSLAENTDGLVRAGLFWLLLPFALHVVATTVEGTLLTLVADLAAVLGLSALAVVWHRMILLSEPLQAPFAPIDGRVLRYVVFGVLVSVIAAAPGVAILVVLGLGGMALLAVGLLAGLVVAVAIFARLQLVFPGIAIDDAGMRLRVSWDVTRGNGGRLLFGVLLTILPVLAAVLLAQFVGAAFHELGMPDTGAFLALLAASVGGWLQAPLVAAFLSYAYLFFRELASRGP